MRNVFLGSIVLILLSLGIALVQISCQKSTAQVSNTQNSESANMILYHKTLLYSVNKDSSGNILSTFYFGNEFYVSDFNGNNTKKIPLTLPQGLYANGAAHLTPDGNIIIFHVTGPPGGGPEVNDIYSCSIDGSNLKKIVEGPIALDDVK